MIELLRIPLKNQPGQLHEVVTTISEAGVDMKALSVMSHGSGHHEVLLLVNNMTRARHALDQAGWPSAAQQAVVVEVADEAGGLAAVLKATTRAQLSINDLFTFVTRVEGKALAVATFDDNNRAEARLRAAGVTTVDQRDISESSNNEDETANAQPRPLDDYLGGSFFW